MTVPSSTMNAEKPCSGLRLLLVGPYPPPFGGIASHLTTLIPGIYQRGAVDIAVVTFGDRDEVNQVDGATVYRFHVRSHTRELFSPRSWPALFATIKNLAGAGFGMRRIVAEAVKAVFINHVAERHASQVVSFYQGDLSLPVLPCADMWGLRRGLVLTVFGEVYDNPDFFAGRKEFAERFLARPYAVASSSKHCACSFAKVIGISREIEPVYYGIDLQRFSVPGLRDTYRADLGVMPDEVLLVYMGRFSEEMGIGRVIDVGPELLAQFPKVKLLLAGAKGPLAGAAATLAQQYPDRVRILHDVPFDLQPSIYSASDVVLAPSADQHACMGMSIKEAMAAGRPVVGSRAGGIPEAIVHEKTGYLVPLDDTRHIDAVELCQYISLLASNPALRESMGVAARQRAEAIFSMEQTIDRMGEIFMAAKPA